ncbi:Xylose isomerase-like TIM barrel [uncultured archaeon]|nr:Xylose isomerase-like TIM barrel [uncultured archaeon]
MAIDESKYLIKPFYQGGYSSLQPSKAGDNFTGYHVKTGGIGLTANPTVANQIGELSKNLNTGAVAVEVGTLSPQNWETIPKQHFAEMRRLGKLTGAKVTLHAPIQGVEPSGLDPQGQRPWDETQRLAVERQLNDVVVKAIDMQGEKGRIPITIHASNLPGNEYVRDGKGGLKAHRLALVNREDGRTAVIEEKKKVEPWMEKESFEGGEKAGKLMDPAEELRRINRDSWQSTLSNIAYNKSFVDRSLKDSYVQLQDFEKEMKEKKISPEELKELGFSPQGEAYRTIKNSEAILTNTTREIYNLFNMAYKNGTDEERAKLFEASEKFKQGYKDGESIIKKSEALQVIINTLQDVSPRIYVPVEEFVMDKSAETFGNVGFKGFMEAKKQHKEAPMISVENLFPGMAFSTGQAVADLVKKSREEFVKKAVDAGEMNKQEAERMAEKVIGMTLDVGHLNIHKKEGIKDEDLMREVEKVKKLVKHVHITDNFGYGDSHLPPGMGNVPIGKVLEQLEKEGYSGTKILEVGGWINAFNTNPYALSLEGLGTPIGSTGGAYWNQSAGLTQGYFGGYGTFLPQINYETFGGGFSTLPAELGGQRLAGPGSRMSGRGLE